MALQNGACNTLAASAGYMIASAADHIVARKSSIVGSIGVLVALAIVLRIDLENRQMMRGGRA